jgi:hypothetical protein
MEFTSTTPQCDSVLREVYELIHKINETQQKCEALLRDENVSMADACMIGATFNSLKSASKTAFESISPFVITTMGSMPEHILPDGSTVERRQASSRKKWDHIGLARSVTEKLHKVTIDMDTGEQTATHDEIMIRLLDYLAPSYWRVKKLSELGINADMYCEVSEGGINLVIRKGDQQDESE